MKSPSMRLVAQFVFVMLCVAVFAACNRIIQSGCKPSPCDPVPDFCADKTNWSTFEQSEVFPSPPARTPRLVLSDGTPIELPATIERALPAPLRTLEIPEGWRDTCRSFLVRAVTNGQEIRATYVRAMRDVRKGVTEIRLFESPSHRSPFVCLSRAEHADEFAVLTAFVADDVVSAVVEYDTAGQPTKFVLYDN